MGDALKLLLPELHDIFWTHIQQILHLNGCRLKSDLQHFHGINQSLDGGQDVAVDKHLEFETVTLGVATAVDDTHLLNEGTFP